VLRGVAQFFANSQYVVNYKVDNKQAPPLVVPSFWGGVAAPVVP